MDAHITRVEVDWCDDYDNAPRLKVFCDTDPWAVLKEITYEVLEVRHAGIDLSGEQVQVIGAHTAKTREKTVVYGEHDCGLVKWVVSNDKEPGGAGAGKYPLKDGTTYVVRSGWYVGPGVCHAAGKGPIMDCSWHLDAEGKRVGLAAGVLLEKIVDPPIWPKGVQILDGDLAWLGQPSKRVWREMERERIAPIRAQIFLRHGLQETGYREKNMSYGEEQRAREAVHNDPEWKSEAQIRPYADLGPVSA